MKLKPILISLLSAAFIADFAFADTVIKAEVDKVKITVGQALTYKLTIESSEKEIPQPNVPEFKGFSILSQSQGSQISIAQGQLKTSVVYIFILSPDTPGKFNIPPSEIKINGKVYSSGSFEIEVAQKASLPSDYPTETEEPQFTI